jgi:hypothetical protein
MADMPDLNWCNPDVQEAMFSIADFWLGRGVDGFRVDSAQQIMKDPLFRDNPASPGTGGSAYKSLGPYDSQLHLYDKDHEDVHDVYRRLRAIIGEHGADRLMLGEVHVHDRPRLATPVGQLLRRWPRRVSSSGQPGVGGPPVDRPVLPACRRQRRGRDAASGPASKPGHLPTATAGSLAPQEDRVQRR